MANNHLNRLIRLARRTGDRLIVTDERGSEEPLVILPLDEYEALIDGAFGMGVEEVGVEEGGWQGEEDVGRKAQGASGEEERGEELEDIQIEDVLVEVESESEPDREALGPDEADVDEEALKSLWVEPETQKIQEKSQEVLKKPTKSAGDGEEGFYLESID